MAHKCLRGRPRPTKASGVRQKIKNEKRNRKQSRIGVKRRAENKAAKEDREAEGEAPAPAPAAPAVEREPRVPKPSPKERRALRQQLLEEKQHRQLFAGGRVLLVGEGNFSFARALCRNLETGADLIATAYDGEATLKRKYSDAMKCRKEVEKKFGGTTLVGVDATRLHKVREFRGAFRTVCWNFPHIGSGEADVEKSVADHRQLLTGFFRSAMKCLDDDPLSAIHVALKSGEPYKSWRIVPTAQAACPGLQLRNVVPFATTAWPGYEHRRTQGFDERFSKNDSEELEKGAKVFVFRRE